MALFVLLLALLGWAGLADACTPGTDCYCDKVKAVGNPIYDASLLMCEDFEAPTLRLNQGVGNGAPFYGPPYDETGQTGNRGVNGYWNRNYSNGVFSALWLSGQPTAPTFGPVCAFGGCTGLKIWSVGDLWTANAYQPLAAFLSNGQYTAEPNLIAPTGTASGTAGSFDGTASMFHRVPAGNTAGILGYKYWTGGYKQNFGVTQATAYAPNISTSGLLNQNWKGNEWITDLSQGGGDGLLLFGLTAYPNGLDPVFPFYQFTFFYTPRCVGCTGGPGDEALKNAQCNTAISTATVIKGVLRCDAAGNAIWEASTSDYLQTRDWPLGTWGCARAYYQNFGTTNTSIQIWFTGPSGVETKLIDMSGVNLSLQYASVGPGAAALAWNAYANANQGGTPASTETSGRYEDNLHIRTGAPVSCSQIGYVGGGVGGGGGPGQTTKRGTGRLRIHDTGEHHYESFRDQFAAELVHLISLGR